MLQPILETFLIPFLKSLDDPWQVGPIRQETLAPARRTGLAYFLAVQYQLLDALGQEVLQPSGNGEFRFVFVQIPQRRFLRPKFDGRIPPFPRFPGHFQIEMIAALDVLAQNRAGSSRSLACDEGLGLICVLWKKLSLLRRQNMLAL